MVLRFDEYCKSLNEGLWTRGLKRVRDNEERLEDKIPPFFKEDDMYEIEGYPGYYISPRGENDNWVVYHAPDEEPICEYDNLEFVNFDDDDEDEDFIFRKGHEYWEDYTVSDNISTEDEKLMTDDDFIEAIYHTIEEDEE